MKFLDRFFGPPTEAKFAKLLIDALHRAGDDQQYVYEEAESRLNITKDRKNIGVINLRNFYTIFRGLPKQDHPEFLKKTCAGLVNRMEIPDDFEDVKADIRPTVRSRSMAELIRLGAEAEGTKYLEVPSIPLSEHLVACLVMTCRTPCSSSIKKSWIHGWCPSMRQWRLLVKTWTNRILPLTP